MDGPSCCAGRCVGARHQSTFRSFTLPRASTPTAQRPSSTSEGDLLYCPSAMAETTAAHAVLSGLETITIEQRPVPSPPAGSVRVRVHSVGICGSDLHYFKVPKKRANAIP